MAVDTPTGTIKKIINRGMSENAKSLLGDLGRKTADLEPDELDTADGSYQALINARGRKSPRFHIITGKGHIIGCGYAYLLGWYYTPPDTLTIYTTTHQFTLSGEGMEIIERAFLREMVLQLREYNKETDTLAPDQKGKALIRKITVRSVFDKSNQDDSKDDIDAN